jgi:hypothetical protein
MSKIVEDIVVGFHTALDRGLLGESLPDELAEHFDSWIEKHHPDVHANADAGEREGLLIDEHEGVAPVVDYFKTVPPRYLPEIFRSLRARIENFYSNTELDPNDELHKAAIDTLARIDEYVKQGKN